MDVDHPERDQRWDDRARQETETERLDRNWSSLLQELRVVQTGVQLLTGFLLTVPFQQHFDILDARMRSCSPWSQCHSGVLDQLDGVAHRPGGTAPHPVSPAAVRMQVSAAHRLAYGGLILLGLALTGVVAIVFDAVAGFTAAVIAGAAALAAFTLFWLVVPLALRARSQHASIP